jgi:hypothetical protein
MKKLMFLGLILAIILIAGCTQQTTVVTQSQEQYDSCKNVVCNDYCSGDILYHNGYCENGQCKYNSEYCQYGCSNGLCNQPTPQQSCENAGNNWCNNQCYNQCPTGQRFNCPSYGNPTCIVTRSIEEVKKSIVYIRHDVTGCCDSYGQYSSLLDGSGSGVIVTKTGNVVLVLTSRHVVDCIFAGTCMYPQSEKITIRTQDGNFYAPDTVSYAPQNLDLAILAFNTPNEFEYAMTGFENYSEHSFGDKVTAIGYPVAGVQSTEPILQFLVSEGSITNTYNLLTYQGRSFNAIQSDALTGHGASGGGLFNQDGHLLGIITWGNIEQKTTIAIDINVISEIVKSQEKFSYCITGYKTLTESVCCPYGSIYVSSDGKCYQPCGNPTTYCKTGSCYYGMCI